MNWQEFEDRLGAEGQEHQTPVDTDALWAKIREKKRRRWLPFFWLFAGIGLVLSGGLALYGRFTHTETAFAKETGLTTNSNPTEAAPLPAVPATGTISTISAMNGEKTAKSTPSAQNNYSRGKPGPLPSITLRKISPADKALTPKAGQQSTFLSEDTKANLPTDQPDLAGLEEVIPAVKRPALLLLPFQPFQPLLIPVHPPALDRPQPPMALASVPLPVKHRSGLSIGINAGYFSWNIERSEPVASPYPRSHEKVLAAVQTGLQVEFPLAQKWSLRSGVQYTEFQSVFRWTDNWQKIDSSENRLFAYERNVQHYNRVQSLAVPVDVLYRFSLGKWSLKPALGVQLQFAQYADGLILKNTRPNAQGYPLIYRQIFNLGLRGGISIEAPLGSKTSLFLEPAARMDLFRRTAKDYPAERFRQWGLQVGIMRSL